MIDRSKKVRVIKNWKHGCYSILQGGRVRASASQIRLANVFFLVRESGRKRMLRGLPKNVHAYAIGELVDFVHPREDRRLDGIDGPAVIYDPFRFDSFVDSATLEPVHAAGIVHFDQAGLRYVA